VYLAHTHNLKVMCLVLLILVYPIKLCLTALFVVVCSHWCAYQWIFWCFKFIFL